MKLKRILIIMSAALMLFIVGCSESITEEGKVIVVEKRIGEEPNFEEYAEITSSDKVNTIKDIIESITWENGVVDTTTAPEYRFYFKGENDKTKERVYDLWANPDGNTSLLVSDSEVKFVTNNKRVTKELYKLIAEGE